MVKNSECRFRGAKVADAAGVAEVYLCSRKTFLPFAPLAHTDEEVRDWIARRLLPSGQVTVAVLDDEIVGMLAVSRDTQQCGWIDQLYLKPGYTGTGIGSAFVRLAKEKLGGPIRLHTFQANEGARRFYERHGFRVVATSDGQDNEEKCPDVLYELRLSGAQA